MGWGGEDRGWEGEDGGGGERVGVGVSGGFVDCRCDRIRHRTSAVVNILTY